MQHEKRIYSDSVENYIYLFGAEKRTEKCAEPSAHVDLVYSIEVGSFYEHGVRFNKSANIECTFVNDKYGKCYLKGVQVWCHRSRFFKVPTEFIKNKFYVFCI